MELKPGETPSGGTAGTEGGDGGTVAGTGTTPDSTNADEANVIKALREEKKAAKELAKSLQERLTAIEAQAKTDAEKALAEQGNFKTLAEQRAGELEAMKARMAEHDALKARLDTIEKQAEESVKSKRESIAKDPKKAALLDDLLQGKTPTEQLSIIERHMELIGGVTAKPGGGLSATGPERDQSKLTDEERRMQSWNPVAGGM